MKYLSNSMTSASGSIGGTTYSHNKGGLYTRARRVPTNPQTPLQQDQRDSLSAVAGYWRAFPGAVRSGWEAYAAATPWTDSLGSVIQLTGFQMFVRSTSLALRFGVVPTASFPSLMNTGDIPILGPTVDSLFVSEDSGDNSLKEIGALATEPIFTTSGGIADSYVLLFAGEPKQPTRTTARSRTRLYGALAFSATPTPDGYGIGAALGVAVRVIPTADFGALAGFPWALTPDMNGWRSRIMARLWWPDGRVSAPAFVEAEVVVTP